jgi:hypothetical protein
VRRNLRGAVSTFGLGASFVWRFWMCVLALPWLALGLLAGCEPKALAVHLQNVDVMREAIEERAGEPLRAEHGRMTQSSNGSGA